MKKIKVILIVLIVIISAQVTCAEENKVFLILDKDIYYISDNLGVSVLNNSEKEIFTHCGFFKEVYLEWQKLKDGKWEMVNKNPHTVLNKCQSILPNEKIEREESIYYDAIISYRDGGPVVQKTFFGPGKYRLVFYYWNNSVFKGEAKQIFSKDFSIEVEEASKITLGFNFDQDKENEKLVMSGFIVGEEGDEEGWGSAGYMYVLDKQNEEYKKIWEWDTRGELDGYNIVSRPKILDIDEDGINELYLKASVSGGTGTSSTRKKILYFPKNNEFFSVSETTELVASDYDVEDTKVYTDISSNLELEKYKVFKEFLLSE